VTLKTVKEKIIPKNVLVVGDLMVDHYTYGKAKRISPEAPVPVVQVERENNLPGGAGNVMCNLSALGMRVIALCRIGEDNIGALCRTSLEKQGIDTQGIVVDHTFTTPIKNRIIADTQQIVRVDYEKKTALSLEAEQKSIAFFLSKLPNLDAIAISDYAKGFCTLTLLETIFAKAKEYSIPIIADPKSNNFERYKGATVLKPNLAEATRAANLSEDATLDNIARVILQHSLCKYLMITRSQEGISLFSKEGRKDFPAFVHEVKDVTGAGDTVCAVITAALANNLSLDEATVLANKAASHAVQRVGCVQVSLNDLESMMT
jgi:D-beta-D-heptose 7-phosphate kinase/D-beta-D-heptose 1-phosphate adenosyltransferase